MSSSSQIAVCRRRGRLLHRSKNLERHVLTLPSGAEIFLGLRPSTAKTYDGRNDGSTFTAGFNWMKRRGERVTREMKDELWHGY